MERKFPPGRLQGAPGLPLLNLEKLDLGLRGDGVRETRRYGARGLAGGVRCRRDAYFFPSALQTAS